MGGILGGLLKFQIFLGVLKIPVFWGGGGGFLWFSFFFFFFFFFGGGGVNGRCWAQAYI